MHALTVVEDLDVLEGFGLHLGMRGATNAMNRLVFETVETAFRQRVIPAISLATYRAGHTVFLELLLERLAGILAAPIRVMQHPRRWALSEPCNGQRIGHQIGRHARLDRPADNLTIEQIENDG